MSILEVMTKLDPKGQQFSIGTGGKPDIDWQDVCGAIASLPSILQDYAFLLHNPRAGGKKLAFVKSVAIIVIAEVEKSGIKCRKQNLDALCEAIASTAVVQALNPNLKMTRLERMAAGGVVMDDECYRVRWERFELDLLDRLESWQSEVEWTVSDYMRETKRVSISA
jgi:hypothetical protein